MKTKWPAIELLLPAIIIIYLLKNILRTYLLKAAA